MAQAGLRVGQNLGVLRAVGSAKLGQPNVPLLSEGGLAQMAVAAGGLQESRAPEVEISDLERRLVKVFLGATPTAEARGMFVVDESLMEEATKYTLSKPCSFLSFGVRGSPSSFFGVDKAMVVANQGLGAIEGPTFVTREVLVDPLRVI